MNRAGWSRGRVGLSLLAAVGVVSGLVGCAPALAVGDSRARDAARSGADRLAKAADDSRPRYVLASDLAYEYAQPNSAWRRSPGIDARLSADAISWEGQTRDPDGARFVMRISTHVSSGGLNQSSGDWSGCFAFRAYPFFAWKETSVREVSCPPGTPTPPPSRYLHQLCPPIPPSGSQRCSPPRQRAISQPSWRPRSPTARCAPTQSAART